MALEPQNTPSPSISLMEAELQIAEAKKIGLPLPSALNKGIWYLTRRSRPQAFLILSKFELKQLNSS